MTTHYARCDGCGIKTVPDHDDLTREETLCDRCYYTESTLNLKIALKTIYTMARAVETGWTAPVYRDVLSSIEREAKIALEQAEQ